MEEVKEKKMPRGKPWQPGQSGNPAGRPPKELCLTSILKEKLLEIPEEVDGKPNTEGKSRGELIVDKAVELATRGDERHLREVWDRIEGKVPQAIGLGGLEDRTRELLEGLAANRRGNVVGTNIEEEGIY